MLYIYIILLQYFQSVIKIPNSKGVFACVLCCRVENEAAAAPKHNKVM